mmetsp:Transcript_1924/g.6378  ORF Transcript_1924/g.6378 Transcript_1924/m.6378 type:complete len:260 (-) Transcript_1924:61-840(-)
MIVVLAFSPARLPRQLSAFSSGFGRTSHAMCPRWRPSRQMYFSAGRYFSLGSFLFAYMVSSFRLSTITSLRRPTSASKPRSRGSLIRITVEPGASMRAPHRESRRPPALLTTEHMSKRLVPRGCPGAGTCLMGCTGQAAVACGHGPSSSTMPDKAWPPGALGPRRYSAKPGESRTSATIREVDLSLTSAGPLHDWRSTFTTSSMGRHARCGPRGSSCSGMVVELATAHRHVEDHTMMLAAHAIEFGNMGAAPRGSEGLF